MPFKKFPKSANKLRQGCNYTKNNFSTRYCLETFFFSLQQIKGYLLYFGEHYRLKYDKMRALLISFIQFFLRKKLLYLLLICFVYYNAQKLIRKLFHKSNKFST